MNPTWHFILYATVETKSFLLNATAALRLVNTSPLTLQDAVLMEHYISLLQ